MSRPRHNVPACERLLKEIERKDWRVTGGGSKHFKIWCLNPCKCMTVVSTTPGKRPNMQVLKAQLMRATCWEEDK